jgi:hypothetical protein
MNHQNLHNESINLAKKLQKNIEQQTKLMNAKLNEMPQEKREFFAQHQAELNRVLKVAENGSIGDLQKIMDKHANTSNNR